MQSRVYSPTTEPPTSAEVMESALIDVVFRSADVGMCITDAAGRYVRVNEAYLAIYGFAEEDVIGRDFSELVLPPDGQSSGKEAHRNFILGPADESAGEWDVVRKDGTPLRVFVKATRLETRDGERFMVATVTDVTRRDEERRALAFQTERLWERDREANLVRERLALAQEAAGFGIFDYDLETGEVVADAAMRALYGLAEGAPITGSTWQRHVAPQDRADVRAAVARTRATGERFDRRFRIRRADGEERAVHATAAVTEWREGRPARITGINVEVTEEEAAKRALQRLAYEDPLTGLANRAAAMHRLETMPRLKDASHALVAVFDVDGLRQINRRSGEHAGDRVLQLLAGRLAETFPGFVARLGMDAFLAIGIFPSRRDAEAALERTCGALDAAYPVQGLALTARTRTGYAITPACEERSGPDLFDDALLALEEAKRRNVRRLAYQPSLGAAAREERQLADALESALDERQLQVVYQPQVDLRTGTLAGVEALLRWYLPGRGEVSPETFIPLAERTGAILRIAEFLAETVAADAARWNAAGVSIGTLSLNVSPVQVADAGFLDYVSRLKQSLEALPGRIRLEIELTETDYIQPSAANIAKLQAVRALDVGIAIDDFGKGYSSLAYLEAFPVDVIKIDRCFVARIEESAYARTLIATVSALAAAIGADVVAEGIETPAQAVYVARQRLRVGQGFLFARPASAEAVPTLARRGFSVPGAAAEVADINRRALGR